MEGADLFLFYVGTIVFAVVASVLLFILKLPNSLFELIPLLHKFCDLFVGIEKGFFELDDGGFEPDNWTNGKRAGRLFPFRLCYEVGVDFDGCFGFVFCLFFCLFDCCLFEECDFAFILGNPVDQILLIFESFIVELIDTLVTISHDVHLFPHIGNLLFVDVSFVVVEAIFAVELGSFFIDFDDLF